MTKAKAKIIDKILTVVCDGLLFVVWPHHHMHMPIILLLLSTNYYKKKLQRKKKKKGGDQRIHVSLKIYFNVKWREREREKLEVHLMTFNH